MGHGKQMHMGVGLWPRGNVLVGLYGIWQGLPRDRPKTAKALDGLRIDLGLAISNDGVHFRAPVPNFTFLEHGDPGEWDSIALLQGHAFANVGDKTYIWYSHWDAEEKFRSQEIGLATLRRDGFGYLSRHSAGNSGQCVSTTIPRLPRGGQVFVNASGVSPSSPLCIDRIDGADRPIPGYSGPDAARITSEGVRQPAVWGSGQSASVPADRPSTLQINFPDSDAVRLFAVYVVPQ
jgi:hypothetical protein